jgi:NTE family protein
MNITLALSGGGIKGFAHIGVIRILEREGFMIRGVAGTSAGGLVGALYASGYSPDEMEDRLRDIDQGNLFARMHGDGPAIFGFAGVTAILSDLLGERRFDDLRIPLALTATDLNTGLPVVIKQGKLMDGVLATSAVPGVFPAKQIAGHLLVDGGVMNPIPVAEARAFSPGIPVVAVVLSPPLGWQVEEGINSSTNVTLLMANLPLVYRLAGRLRLAQAFNLFIHAMDLTGQTLMDKQLKLEKPSVIIRPKLRQIGIIDHVDVSQVIRAGEQAAQEAIPDLIKAGEWQQRLRQRIAGFLTLGRGSKNGA